MKRKALSPLITTILLIIVTFALIGIVLTWGKSFAIGNLGQTDDVVSTSCNGAYIKITNCKVSSDGNMTFYVTNIGNSYTFASTDTFKMDISSDTGGYKPQINMTSYTNPAWAGLAPGQTTQVDYNLTAAGLSGTLFSVTVKSAVCPSDAVNTYSDCRQ